MNNAVSKTNEITPINEMKNYLENAKVQEMFKDALKENAGAFISSIIDLYNSDTNLQKCETNEVIMEALKAATLKLPINRQLGFAYIVPYKDKPQFQIGYKGYIQLAMRTGQYQNLNAGIICEGMEIKENYLAGTIEIHGRKKSNKELGYFAYFKLLNGFEKCLYMTKEEVIKHAEKFSKTYSLRGSSWQTNFNAMALKTVTRLLLSKYGILSTDMQNAMTKENDIEFQTEIAENANKEPIDISEYEEETPDSPLTVEDKGSKQQLPGQMKMTKAPSAPF